MRAPVNVEPDRPRLAVRPAPPSRAAYASAGSRCARARVRSRRRLPSPISGIKSQDEGEPDQSRQEPPKTLALYVSIAAAPGVICLADGGLGAKPPLIKTMCRQGLAAQREARLSILPFRPSALSRPCRHPSSAPLRTGMDTDDRARAGKRSFSPCRGVFRQDWMGMDAMLCALSAKFCASPAEPCRWLRSINAARSGAIRVFGHAFLNGRSRSRRVRLTVIPRGLRRVFHIKKDAQT